MITITEIGAKRVKEFLEKRGSGFGLRVLIKTTGCSGYAYNLEFADKINPVRVKLFIIGINLISKF